MVKRTLLLAGAFLLAIVLTFVFAYHAGRHARYLRRRDAYARLANEPIRPWMSVPFIAHVHHVPTASLFAAIGVKPQQPRDHRPLRRIASDENRPVSDLIR